MSLLVGKNVSKSFGAFDVFSSLDFSAARGDKIALVGPNGCGKTTLLKIIAGVEAASGNGDVHFARGVTRGYLAQTAEDSTDMTVWQGVQAAFVELQALQARMAELEREMSDPTRAERALERYGETQHEFELKGGYEIDSRVKRVLGGLGFRESHWHMPMSKLSGGQRVRAALAKLLLQSPDVLLLDEPTNHLDTQGIEWLESFLSEWEGTLIVVSHDRYFIDEVCDHIWEMSRAPDGQARLSDYHGSYTDYVDQREARRERAQKDYEAQREFIAKEQEFIRRNMNSQLTAQARGRLRRLNRLERLERPNEQRALALKLGSAHRSGDRVLETRNLQVGYRAAGGAPTTLFQAPDLLLLRTERVALIGPNGVGKTTFLKTILGEIAPIKGEAALGAAVRIGYFAQAHEKLDPAKTILDELMDAQPELKLSAARDLLGRFLFSGDDQFKKIEMLSGGERGRVALAKLTLEGANVLLLDEPTNHLDIPAQEVITEALRNFDGTLLFVSHDRYLIAALATQLWMLDRDDAGTRLNVFKGTYDEWRNARDDAAAALAEAKPKPIEAKAATETAAVGATDAAAARISKNKQQQRVQQMAALEQRIAGLEREMSELGAAMETVGGDFERLQTLSADYAKAERNLNAAWAEYETLA
jgi:ATP-binding cassette subfamily F protein 3